MLIFTTNPEALEYGPGQSWLSPNEAAKSIKPEAAMRARLTERRASLMSLLRKVEDELHYLGRA